MSLITNLVDENGQVHYWAAQLLLTPTKSHWDVSAIQKQEWASGYSRNQIEKLIITELGGIAIKPEMLWQSQQVKTNCTLEAFRTFYEFGKFPNVLDWLPWVAENTNYYLTRQELYDYILRSTGAESQTKDTTVKYRLRVY